MKRTLWAIAVLAMITSCGPKPAVFTGTVKGNNGDPLYLSISGTIDKDTILVAEDGSFRYEKAIEDVIDGFLFMPGAGNTNVLLIPGEISNYDVDLTIKPTIWTYSGDNKDAVEYLDYFRDDYGSIFNLVDPPATFKEYEEYWDGRQAEAKEKLSTVKKRNVREFFDKKINDFAQFCLFNYGWQIKKRGQAYSDDPDYMAFFNSIDLTDENNARNFLGGMIMMKSEMYDEPEETSLRYIKAIEELSPDKHTSDSLTAAYLDGLFNDCKIYSEKEGDFLLEKAAGIGTDGQTMDKYREMTAKALSILPGCDEIDFEVVAQNGKTVKLSNFKGKAVYIDFWATWCLPCCMQIPFMEKVAEKYKGDSRIVTISISLDKNVPAWEKKLAEDNPAWPQYRAADGGKAIQTAYGFNAIPRFMLFDKDGKIVSVDAPRPQDMEAVCALIDKTIN